MTITKQITLDVSRPNNIPAISAKQFDEDSRFLKIYLVNGGEELSVESDSAVLINVLRADGESNSYSGSVNEDGSVTVPLSNWLLSVEGMASASVSIVQDGVRLTSLSFDISVQVCETSDEPSEDEKDVWAQALSDIAEIESVVAELKPVVAELSAESNEILNAVGYEAELKPTDNTYQDVVTEQPPTDTQGGEVWYRAGIIIELKKGNKYVPVVFPHSDTVTGDLYADRTNVNETLARLIANAQQLGLFAFGGVDFGEYDVGGTLFKGWLLEIGINGVFEQATWDLIKQAFEEQVVNVFRNTQKFTWQVPPQAITKELKEI